VERVIDPREAAVVKRIFQLYDSGLGLKKIARTLNTEGALEPPHFKRKEEPEAAKVQGWCPSTVRGVLRRELYRGVQVWNKTRNKDSRYGMRLPKAAKRPEAEWVTTPVPHLRIIDEALWKRVASRRDEVEHRAVRFESGRISGRPPKHATQNLL